METIKMRLPPEASEDRAPEIGPKVSPYASPSCKVYFRSGQPFIVPRGLLREGLESICYKSNEIRLENVLDECGHVVIHYLHTGRWQTLDDADLPGAARLSKRLEVSLLVYGTAQTYNLPGLAELSKQKISQYAGALPALQVLVLASDACQLLGEGDLWFSTFIKLRVEELFQDASSQEKTRFLTCFDTATPYSKMLVKLIVEICCRNSAPFCPESQPNTPPAEPELPEPYDPTELSTKYKKKKKKRNPWEHPAEEEAPPVAIADPEPEPAPASARWTESEPEPAVEAAPDPQTVYELGWPTSMSKTDRKESMESLRERPPEEEAPRMAIDAEPEPVPDLPGPAQWAEAEAQSAREPADLPAVHNGGWTTPTPKEKKKKKKKASV
ncbi:uncharacterized protein LY79DRAFT_523998 [Colletotrichum navitas]|uniref:BTB domain-containing protein n=1 Tax=Colletotrichum navitas TaxID=681940 RepID=A0AAD8PRL6_9PEZI|nr:uncharacterized protein LY79DRAFT_523998 [Colletotrichum navitas]KAK1574399.1 hypothetical protein LY79DRAFT_523998 [Colletotrichum navitas]